MLRGEIWLLNLDPTLGAEIKKTRPGIIVNDNAVGVLPLKVIVPNPVPPARTGTIARPDCTTR
ncbi:MAG: hypothetical protein EXS58_10900 [Candidatus Latescibacteria bacterium]|nr:hypothetical protein [Candidatus Latescibacterota bacterium]